MESITTVLLDKDFSQPDELTKLKDYILKNYDADTEIRMHPKGLVIITGSSSLAGTLRLRLPQIKRELEIKLPIIIRVA